MLSVFTFGLIAQASATAVSPLVPPSHAHDWRVVVASAEGVMSIDHAWHENHSQQGKTYPVVLTRMISGDPEGKLTADVRLAVDCAARKTGLVAISMDSSTREGGHRSRETVRFDFAEDPPSPFDEIVMDYACNTQGGTETGQ